MPTIQLSLREDVSEKSRKASSSFGGFVTSVNQGLELIQRVGGQAYRALDDMFETAGKSEQLRSGFVSLSGSVEKADANLAAVQGALRGTVSQMEAMEIANMAMSFGLVDSAEQLGEMTEIGAVLAQSLGQDASKGVADLTLALSRQSPMILDNLGISLKLNDAYEMYAESLGKTASQLTETEKSQAFLNSALEIGRQKVAELGGFVESSATDWDRFKAALEDSKVNLAEFVTGADGMSGVLADAGEWIKGASQALAGIGPTVDLARDAFSGFTGGVGDLIDTLRDLSPIFDANMTQLESLPGFLGDAVEGYKEMAAGAEAMARASEREAALIREVNDALGTNFTRFSDAAAAARENRAAMQAHREETNSGGKALHDYNEELREQEKAQEAAADEADAFRMHLQRLGLTVDDTAASQEKAEREFRESWEAVRKSGEYTAEQLQKAWDDFFDSASSGSAGMAIDIIGDNTELVHDLSEAFGPGMFTAEDAAFATWIDREKAELVARQDEIMGPISDAVEGGLEDGFDSVEIDRFTGKLEKRMRESLLDVWHDEELVSAIAEAMGIFTGQGIGDTGASSLGMSMDDLSKRDQARAKDIMEQGAFDAIVSQGLAGAMNAIEAGDFLALQRIREGALNNAAMARQRGNSVTNRDFIESNLLLADLVRDLVRVFGIEVPGFAAGGVGDFGVESLARLHGREAIIPLNRGGGEVRDAIMGGDVMPALHALAEETRFQTELVGSLLSDVALNTRAAIEDSDRGLSALRRYKEARHERMLEVARDPSLAADGGRVNRARRR